MMMQLTGKNLIDGQWIGEGTHTLTATNPATGETLPGTFHRATPDEIDRAFTAAQAAFDATRGLPAERWAALLEAIAEQIEAMGDALLERASAESALPKEPRLVGERARTTGQLRMFATLVREGSWVDAIIDLPQPDRKPLPRSDLRRQLESIGPVVVFDASNFPFAYGACGGDTASALAAGNPVIVKSHPAHPGTNELMAAAVLEALKKSDMPVGLFSMIQGDDVATGEAVVKHPATAAVGFTGSLRGGRAIFNTAAARPTPIPVYAEMGSLNPIVLLPDAIRQRRDTIVQGLTASITLGAGQFCTKPGLVLVKQGDEGDAFIAALAKSIAGTPRYTMLNASLRDAFKGRIERFTEASGLRAHLQGTCEGHADASASLFEVDAKTWRKQPELQHEAFGPAALVLRYADLDDLRDTLTVVEGSLTGSVQFAEGDQKELPAVVEVLRRIAGRVIFNGYPTGVEVCPAMVHGGPYPATTAPQTTSVGTTAIRRFARPVCYQDAPASLLPPALQDGNPLGILRTVDGKVTQ